MDYSYLHVNKKILRTQNITRHVAELELSSNRAEEEGRLVAGVGFSIILSSPNLCMATLHLRNSLLSHLNLCSLSFTKTFPSVSLTTTSRTSPLNSTKVTLTLGQALFFFSLFSVFIFCLNLIPCSLSVFLLDGRK